MLSNQTEEAWNAIKDSYPIRKSKPKSSKYPETSEATSSVEKKFGID